MLGEDREPSEQPSERALAYDRVTDAVTITLLWSVITIASTAGLSAADMLESGSRLAAFVGVALLVLLQLLLWFVGFVPAIALRYRRYELTEEGVYTQRGFFGRERTVLPYARIQFVSSSRGPIERRFGLASVVIQTAASAVAIPMLDDEVAEELRDRLSMIARRSIDDI